MAPLSVSLPIDLHIGSCNSTYLKAMYPTLVVVIVTIRRSVLEYTLNLPLLSENITVGFVDGPIYEHTIHGRSGHADDEKRMSTETHRTVVVSQVDARREIV